MHFGIRRMYVPDPDNEGVQLVELAPETEEDTIQHAVLNNPKRLKYKEPNDWWATSLSLGWSRYWH